MSNFQNSPISVRVAVRAEVHRRKSHGDWICDARLHAWASVESFGGAGKGGAGDPRDGCS